LNENKEKKNAGARINNQSESEGMREKSQVCES
jgi:hypothetical protein